MRDIREKLALLAEMGLSAQEARDALTATGGDVHAAIECVVFLKRFCCCLLFLFYFRSSLRLHTSI
jgi:hypothetical protein